MTEPGTKFPDDHSLERAIIETGSLWKTETPVRQGTATGKYRISMQFLRESLAVFLDGIRVFDGEDFMWIDSQTIEFFVPPSSSAKVRVEYVTPDQKL